jgi:hypothetical protein
MGAIIPVYSFIAGNMIDSFANSSTASAAALTNLYYFIVLGVIAMIIGATMFAGWMITGERQAFRCRQEYFRSLLRQ